MIITTTLKIKHARSQYVLQDLISMIFMKIHMLRKYSTETYLGTKTFLK